MKLQLGTKISPIFSVLAGKRGPKPAVFTGLAIVAEAAAIGVGTAFVVCAWPLSAAFFAASLVTTGISSGTNGAGALGSHKHFAQITELSQRNVALQQEEKRLLELLEEPQEQAKASDPDPGNSDIQNSPKEKKSKALISVLKGKHGAKPAIWGWLTIAAEAAAIGAGITVAVGAWPVTAAFFAASIATTGITSALNSASSVSNHKHFKTITELLEKNAALQEGNIELEKRLVAQHKTQQTKPQAASAPGPR